MVAKPTNVPEWDRNQVNLVEPSEAKKDIGWQLDEIPPSSFFNWHQNRTGQWISWINEKLHDPLFVSDPFALGIAVKGSTKYGVFELRSEQADASGVILGQLQWTDKNAVTTDKRAVLIQGVTGPGLFGSTPNDRSGVFEIFLKRDAADAPVGIFRFFQLWTSGLRLFSQFSSQPGTAISIGSEVGGVPPNILVDRMTVAGTPADTTIRAAGALAGQANTPGGIMKLYGGISTGNQGSSVEIGSFSSAGAGSADNVPTQALIMDYFGNCILRPFVGSIAGTNNQAIAQIFLANETGFNGSYTTFSVPAATESLIDLDPTTHALKVIGGVGNPVAVAFVDVTFGSSSSVYALQRLATFSPLGVNLLYVVIRNASGVNATVRLKNGVAPSGNLQSIRTPTNVADFNIGIQAGGHVGLTFLRFGSNLVGANSGWYTTGNSF